MFPEYGESNVIIDACLINPKKGARLRKREHGETPPLSRISGNTFGPFDTTMLVSWVFEPARPLYAKKAPERRTLSAFPELFLLHQSILFLGKIYQGFSES